MCLDMIKINMIIKLINTINKNREVLRLRKLFTFDIKNVELMAP